MKVPNFHSGGSQEPNIAKNDRTWQIQGDNCQNQNTVSLLQQLIQQLNNFNGEGQKGSALAKGVEGLSTTTLSKLLLNIQSSEKNEFLKQEVQDVNQADKTNTSFMQGDQKRQLTSIQQVQNHAKGGITLGSGSQLSNQK